jgi:hypothetical protein
VSWNQTPGHPAWHVRPPRTFPAVETEALSQRVIQRILIGHLDAMLPEPLADMLEREEAQRVDVCARLEKPGLGK